MAIEHNRRAEDSEVAVQTAPDPAGVAVGGAVTLQHVAVAAGVHKSTAARALNHDPRISAATRQRVEQTARQLGYRMNHLLAAWMRTRRRGVAATGAVIAYVTCHPTRFGWRPPESDLPDFHPGAVQRARLAGYAVEQFWLREAGMAPERFADALRARRVHGVLIGRIPASDTSLLACDWSGFAVVVLGMSGATPAFHRVRENHFFSANVAASKCFDRGYRRIGLVLARGDEFRTEHDWWLGGFGSAQARWPDEGHRVPPLIDSGCGRDTFMSWFKAHRPDAVIASEAHLVREWLAQAGWQVPLNMGLVDLRCYDPKEGNAGVHLDPARLGALGVEMLFGQLFRQERGVPVAPHEVLVQGTWNEGRTLASGPAAARS